MRWVNIKNGIKQRLNEILGTSDGAGAYPMTYWSIQAAMLENSRRIVKALVGDSLDGRPMKGCWITRSGGGNINISPGLACTPNGDIIVFDGVTSKNLGVDHSGELVLVYLKHTNAEIGADYNEGIGKKTGLIGQSGSYEIINDDSGVDSQVSAESLLYLSVSEPSPGDDYAYLGSVQMTGSEISSEKDISNSKKRGLAPNAKSSDEELLVQNLRVGDDSSGEAEFYNIMINGSVKGHFTFNNTINFADEVTFAAVNHTMNGALDCDTTGGTVIFRNGSGAVKVGEFTAHSSATFTTSDSKTVTVKQGIITSVV